MNEHEMIQLLNILIAFFLGAALGSGLMMANYGFFHRAKDVIIQKQRAKRGMATRFDKPILTCGSDEAWINRHSPETKSETNRELSDLMPLPIRGADGEITHVRPHSIFDDDFNSERDREVQAILADMARNFQPSTDTDLIPVSWHSQSLCEPVEFTGLPSDTAPSWDDVETDQPHKQECNCKLCWESNHE